MPVEKKLSALEEAEFEDGEEETALEREMLAQSMQTLRVYRPRVIIHGDLGMGQGYIGAAALHHLEGYHIQSLELGTLLGDSTRVSNTLLVTRFCPRDAAKLTLLLPDRRSRHRTTLC